MTDQTKNGYFNIADDGSIEVGTTAVPPGMHGFVEDLLDVLNLFVRPVEQSAVVDAGALESGAPPEEQPDQGEPEPEVAQPS